MRERAGAHARPFRFAPSGSSPMKQPPPACPSVIGLALLVALLGVAGCGGTGPNNNQNALHPAGSAAHKILNLMTPFFWVAVVIGAGVVGMTIFVALLAILYPTRAELADALRRLIDAGIPLDGASDHGVSEALYLRDPDGNGVELYWDRPPDQWPRTPQGELAMTTDPLDLDDLLKARE